MKVQHKRDLRWWTYAHRHKQLRSKRERGCEWAEALCRPQTSHREGARGNSGDSIRRSIVEHRSMGESLAVDSVRTSLEAQRGRVLPSQTHQSTLIPQSTEARSLSCTYRPCPHSPQHSSTLSPLIYQRLGHKLSASWISLLPNLGRESPLRKKRK